MVPGWLTKVTARYANSPKMSEQFLEAFTTAGLHTRRQADVEAFFVALYGVRTPSQREHSMIPGWWLVVWCDTGLLPEAVELMAAVYAKETLLLNGRPAFSAGFVEAAAAGLNPAYARAVRAALGVRDIRVITEHWTRGTPVEYLLEAV